MLVYFEKNKVGRAAIKARPGENIIHVRLGSMAPLRDAKINAVPDTSAFHTVAVRVCWRSIVLPKSYMLDAKGMGYVINNIMLDNDVGKDEIFVGEDYARDCNFIKIPRVEVEAHDYEAVFDCDWFEPFHVGPVDKDSHQMIF